MRKGTALVIAFLLVFAALIVAPASAGASSAGWICQTKYASQYEHCDRSDAHKVDVWAENFARGWSSIARNSIYNFVANAKYYDFNNGTTRNADMCATAASMVGNGPGYPQVYSTLQQANLFYATGVVC